MGVRASLSALLASTALSGPARASLHAAMVAEQLFGNARVSLHAAIISQKRGAPARVSGEYMIVAQSANHGVWFNLFTNDESTGSHLYGVTGWAVTLAASPTPEYNPYKPIVPDSMRESLGDDGYEYIEENQETLRQQHNLIQAGDTTFPYQLTIASSAIQHYRLGSVGRFYHETYGIIQARYVQFKDMVDVGTPHCPVGLFRTATGLDWVVTNDYSKSSGDLVVGIACPWTLAANNDFGWVIVDGPNLQQIRNLSTTQSLGEALVWADDGALSNTASGKVVARRVGKTDITRLPAGALWVRTESFSEAQINDFITAGTRSLLDQLNALERAIQALPSASVLHTLQATVTSLRTTISNEASSRIAADLRLNERISNLNYVSIGQLNAAISTAMTGVAAEINVLETQITNIINNLTLQSGRIDDVTGRTSLIETDITTILDMLARISLIPEKLCRFPVVDGSVPPNLVYLDDGSLVYTEE
jgi:hypothetical protein